MHLTFDSLVVFLVFFWRGHVGGWLGRGVFFCSSSAIATPTPTASLPLPPQNQHDSPAREQEHTEQEQAGSCGCGVVACYLGLGGAGDMHTKHIKVALDVHTMYNVDA
jgi:hypothetical protein